MNATRNCYFNILQKAAQTDKRIVFVNADCAGFVFDDFRREYPNQFVNVGIAEQNLIAVSAGLALAGKIPIAYAHAPFVITRAFDQIRSAIGVMHLPISIIANGVGFAQPWFGATHFNTEDSALVGTIPGINVFTPSSPQIAKLLADYTLSRIGPIYVRFDPNCDDEIHNISDLNMDKGFQLLRSGTDLVIISNGSYSHRCLKLADKWYNNACSVSASIIDVFSSSYDIDSLLCAIGDLPVLVVEEQIEIGSMGSRLLIEMNRNCMHNKVNMMNIEFNDSYPLESVSNIEYYLRRYSFTDSDITKAAFQSVELARKE